MASSFLREPALNLSSIPTEETTPSYQSARHVFTVAKVAHTILHSTRLDPSPEIFFDAYKTYIRLSKKSKTRENIYRIRRGLDLSDHPVKSKSSFLTRLKGLVMLVVRAVEHTLAETTGLLNNWGESMLRPVGFAVVTSALFTVVYWFSFTKKVGQAEVVLSFWESLRMGIDVTLVAGYTKYNPSDEACQWILLANLILGITWYSIFVPTVVRHTMRG